MGKKTPIDQLSASISKILAEYEGQVSENLTDAVKKVARKGAKAVSQEARSKFGGSGKYASGWTSRVDTGRLSTQGFIYNKAEPGLAHLLEHGHVSKNGTQRVFGRVEGREHIAPVEQAIVEEFEKEVKNGI